MKRLLTSMATLVAVLAALVSPVTLVGAQEVCRLILPARNGWAIELCPTDPAAPTPMDVILEGSNVGKAARIAVYHVSGRGSLPQVAILYASGFVRLKQNQDPPGAPIPFGTSAVLGPAYWPNANTYYHNPHVQTLRITTAALPGRLDLHATGQTMPSGLATRCSFPPRPTCGRTFAWSSRYVANNGAQRLVPFRNLTPSTFVYSPTRPLGGRWLDALHRDDASWQGNTPWVRVCVGAIPAGRTFTPQGFITATTNPNDDNVGLWVHDDHRASVGWAASEQEVTRYWLVAQDDLLTSDPQRCW